MRRRRKREEQESLAPADGGPPRWLELARDEIRLRERAAPDDQDERLDQLLQMQARTSASYPDIPVDVLNEFTTRLRANGYTEDAWDAAVEWLETTVWFQARRRYPK